MCIRIGHENITPVKMGSVRPGPTSGSAPVKEVRGVPEVDGEKIIHLYSPIMVAKKRNNNNNNYTALN